MVEPAGGYNPAVYKIWTRAYFGRLEQVQNWSSFKCNLKWGDVSTWELVMPMSEYHRAYETDGQVGSTYIFAFGGIVVYRDDDFLIGGPIISAHRVRAGDDDLITLTGASDTHWLSQRIIWPSPLHPYEFKYDKDGDIDYNESPADYFSAWYKAQPPTGYPPTDWTKFHGNPTWPATDPVSNIMCNYVKYHLGTSAWAGTFHYSGSAVTHTYDRRLQWVYGGVTKYLQVPYPTRDDGPSVTHEGRFETLLDMCKKISHIPETETTTSAGTLTDEIDFFIKNSSDGYLYFDTATVTDISSSAIFGTDLGTIRSFELTETRPEYNALFIGGDEHYSGDISTRKFVYTQPAVAEDSQGIYGRIESFYDFSITDASRTIPEKLQDMLVPGRADVNEHAYNIVVKLVLEDSDAVKFLEDYNIGYLVTVDVGDYVYTDIIREIDVTVDPSSGEVIEPIIASARAYYGKGGAPDKIRDARKAILALQRMRSTGV